MDVEDEKVHTAKKYEEHTNNNLQHLHSKNAINHRKPHDAAKLS